MICLTYIQVEEKALLHIFEVQFLLIQSRQSVEQSPSDVVSGPSVNAFKKRLDKHWKQYCFTLNP